MLKAGRFRSADGVIRMQSYAFWNNKGGTGKTSLAFQAITRYAELHPDQRILVVDACPQANLSELLLGGLVGTGSNHLIGLHNQAPRRALGGYFQDRLPSPFSLPVMQSANYICTPQHYNRAIPQNIDMIAGDPLIELQANAIATLANTQIPGTNTWITIMDWIAHFIEMNEAEYDIAFIDTNPSFSIYTQMALAATNRLIVPVMADDSSRRAIQNVFSLVYGLQLPSPIYSQYAFATKLAAAGRNLPQVHLIIRNRITQYMGEASAYAAVLRSIDQIMTQLMVHNPGMFTFDRLQGGAVSVRDFQTTGVVAFAKGLPFSQLNYGRHDIAGHETRVS